jgi:hypothetical protein
MKKNVLSFPTSAEHSLDSQLKFAIANKLLIRFTYESAVRLAEPHDYGCATARRNCWRFSATKLVKMTITCAAGDGSTSQKFRTASSSRTHSAGHVRPRISSTITGTFSTREWTSRREAAH